MEEKRVAAHERRAAEQRTLQAPAQQRLVWESEKIREEHHGDRQEVIQPSVVSLPTQEDRRLEQTFSEADSVLRDDTPLAKVEATNGSEEGYTVVCFTCRASFQADDADWCSCLTTRRTLICTNCLTCFCKAPPAYAEAFWSQAPPSLLARRKAPAPRSPVARNPEPDEIVRPLVLSVEVDEEIQLIVQRVCINLGYGFIHAESGSDGLVLARRYRPNLILADDFLPDLDGREMCRSLKDEAIGDGVMVVMTGLYTDLACRTEALKRFRVDDYITKPVAITDLINLLERHLEGVRGLPRQEDLHQLHRALVDRPASSAAIGFDLTDLGSQESGGFSITELAGGSKPSTERYEISCFCGGSYDALVADWCAHAEPTIVCPRCGSCLCDAPASVRERFWLEAPPSLFERRIMLAKRRAISPENPSPDEVPRPVILLVEDDENVNLLVRTVATVLGIGIVVTTDGPDGLVLAMQYRPDLILVDALVPNLDGWQLCRLLKETPPTAAVKVVMMTGLHADRAREREAGPDMDDYIPKPLAVGDLILMIRKHLPQQTRPSM